MLRIVLGMIIGAAAGSALTYYFVADSARLAPADAGSTRSNGPVGTVEVPRGGVREVVLERGVGVRTGLAPLPMPSSTGAPPQIDPGAGVEPPLTLDQALAIANPGERRRALARLATTGAQQDPAGALAAARRIANPQDRLAYQSVLARELARSDPELLLANLNAFGEPEAEAMVIRTLASEPLAAVSPERLLALAEEIDGQMAMFARQVALQRWGETDPAAAIAYAEALPLGQQREQLLSGALRGLAQKDPEAALAWLANQRNPSPQLQSVVYAGIAQTDPERAIDLLFDSNMLETQFSNQMQASAMPLLMTLAQSGGADRARVADRLLSVPSGRQPYLQMFLSNWSQTAPEDAIAWLGRNAAAVGVATYQQVAQNLARNSPERAAGFTSQVPAAARDEWIVGVAQGYAQRDAEATLAWLGQYAGQPVYRQAALAVAQATANYDPLRAAELLATADLDDQRAVGAAAMIAANWAQRDASGARAWITSLPRGAARDGALSALVSTSGAVLPDPATLGLFSSDRAREQALLGVIVQIAQSDEPRARGLLDEYISDSTMRARAEQAIENRAGAGFGVFVTPDGRAIVR